MVNVDIDNEDYFNRCMAYNDDDPFQCLDSKWVSYHGHCTKVSNETKYQILNQA